MTHTPGPWVMRSRLSASENHRGYWVLTEGRFSHVAEVMPRDQDGTEGEANARLIAAAPDLLEALAPFAALADTMTALDDDAHIYGGSMRVRDFRRAARLVHAARGEAMSA